VVVVVVSPDSAVSRNVAKELSVAEERGKRIIPVLHRPAELRGAIELHLTDLQHVDFTSRYDAGLRGPLGALDGASVRGVPHRPTAAAARPRRRRRMGVVAGVGVAAVVALVIVVVAMTSRAGRSGAGSDTTTSAARTTTTVASATTSSPVSDGDASGRGPAIRTLGTDELAVAASSVLPSEPGCGGTCSYAPENLVDGSIATAWAEGQAGDGAAWVEVTFAQPQRIVVISMWPGWQRGEPCLFERNARPQDVLVSFDGHRQPWLVPNEAGKAALEVDVLTSSVRFDIRASYPGSDCGGRAAARDLLISELEFTVAAT
jgi:hypothetical protein